MATTKLHLVIRFNSFAIETLALEPGDYEVGRGSDNAVNINHPSIHRRHGKLTCHNGTWSYQDYTSGQVHAIGDTEPLALSSEIDVATEAYTLSEETGDRPLPSFAKGNRRRKEKLLYGFLIAGGLVIATGLAYVLLKSLSHKADPNQLLSHVRSKVVEFEKKQDPEAINDYKTIGQFRDEDFRENIGYCTGFLVAPNVVLTASHCLWGSDFLDLHTNFEIRTADGKRFVPQRLLGFDSSRDYLFLEMKGMESYGHLEFVEDARVGQTVFTLGNAHGQGIAIREGILASETPDINDPSIKLVRYSAGASPGNSGGPLLDSYGRIVALVFAATGAENYNLGTSAKDLREGFKKFVTDTQSKDVTVAVKKLFNFNITQFLQKQVLPYLPDYNDYPEIAEKMNAVTFTFKVPMEFSALDKTVLNEVTAASTKTVLEIENALLERGEVILSWPSFVSAKTPAIHPSQFDGSQNSFYLYKNRYYMKTAGFLDSPNKKDFKLFVDQFEKEKKLDFQAYGMNTEFQAPQSDSDPIVYAPRDAGKGRTNIEDLGQGSLYSQMVLKQRIDDPDLIKQFLDRYVGDDGVLAGSYSAFIRPQSYRNFTIKKIDKPADKAVVSDGSGREWTRFHFKMFEQVHFYVYCLPVPEGTTCAARLMPVENEVRREQLESNFREHILSHFLENPYFWEPSALAQFMTQKESKGFSSLSGVQFVKSGAHYKLTLSGFKMEMQIPLEAQSVRLQTGLFKGKKAVTEWTGFGAEWVIKGPKPQVCGMGVEPVGSQSIYVLNFLRDSLKRLKLKDDEKKEEIPKLWTEKTTTSLGDEVQVYGYCAPLRENPMEIGYYFVDFKKAQPRSGQFKLIK